MLHGKPAGRQKAAVRIWGQRVFFSPERNVIVLCFHKLCSMDSSLSSTDSDDEGDGGREKKKKRMRKKRKKVCGSSFFQVFCSEVPKVAQRRKDREQSEFV